jgi:hypothetical protein
MYSDPISEIPNVNESKIISEITKLRSQVDQVHDILLQIRMKLKPVLKNLPKGPTGESGPSVHPKVGAPVYEKIRSVSSDINLLRGYAVTLMEDIDL